MFRVYFPIVVTFTLPAAAAEPPPVVVISQPLQRATADFEFRARIDPVEPVEVRATMTGNIGKVHCKVGAEVRKGDVLLEMDPQPILGRVRQGEYRLQGIEAELKSRQSAFDEATRLAKTLQPNERQQMLQAEFAKVEKPLDRAKQSAAELLVHLFAPDDRQEVQRLIFPLVTCQRLAAARAKANVDGLYEEELGRLRQAVSATLAYVQMRKRDGPPPVSKEPQLLLSEVLDRSAIAVFAGKFVAEIQVLQQLLDRVHVLSRARSQQGLDVLAAERNLAEATARSYRDDLDAARKELDRLQVVAPMNGKVLALDVKPGDRVEAGTESVSRLCTIGKDDLVRVSFDVDDGTILRLEDLIRTGKIQLTKREDIALVLRFPKEKDYQHRGTVIDVDRRGDPKTGNVHVVAHFPNPDGKLTPEATAGQREKKDVRVHFTLGDPRQVLLVPEIAVIAETQPGDRPLKQSVLVVNKENEVERREVQTGPLVDGLRVIDHGLTADDWVVIRTGRVKTDPDKPELRPEDFATDIRMLRLKPGTAVDPIKAPLKIDR